MAAHPDNQTELDFLHVKAAKNAFPRTVSIMNKEKRCKSFHKFNKENKGFITTVDVQRVLEVKRALCSFV
ncbi:hypothetical protein MHYP_G00064670 [Metynnis hypsauchen]